MAPAMAARAAIARRGGAAGAAREQAAAASADAAEPWDEEQAAAAEQPDVTGRASRADLVSAIVFIAGTTIGGGALALPASAAPAGVVPSITALVLVWLWMTVQAILLVEVTVRMKQEESGAGDKGNDGADAVVSFERMAERTIGRVGGQATGMVYQIYSYLSLLAYVAVVGDVIAQLSGGLLASEMGQALAVFGIWGVILGFGKRGVMAVNEKLNYVFLFALAGILAAGLFSFDLGVLGHAAWSKAPAAAGIILFNVVYHDVIPVICDNLKYDVKAIKTALVLGGGIPLLAYVGWIAAVLSAAGGAMAAGVDPVQVLMAGGDATGTVLQWWGLLAIITSFIGFTIAQAEYEADLFAQWTAPLWAKAAAASDRALLSAQRVWDKYGREQLAYASVLLPPLAVSLALPGLFVVAADLAGVYGVALLYGVLPPVMTFVLRRDQQRPSLDAVPGGNATLAALLLAGLGLMADASIKYLKMLL